MTGRWALPLCPWELFQLNNFSCPVTTCTCVCVCACVLTLSFVSGTIRDSPLTRVFPAPPLESAISPGAPAPCPHDVQSLPPCPVREVVHQ